MRHAPLAARRSLAVTATLLIASAAAAFAVRAEPAKLPPVLPPPEMNSPAAQDATEPSGDAIARALAGDWRSEANRARDKYRHPKETLAFFGVDPEAQTLLEIWPGGGWYAEVLAPAFNAHGHYVAIVPQPLPDSPARVQRDNDKLRAMFKARPDLYSNAEVREALDSDPVLGPPESADVVLTFRNAHNWVMAGNEQAMFRAFFAVLKPGGTLGVVDHRAAPDQPPAEMKTSGYLPQDYVIALAQAAGFELVATSEINANPKDTKDYPKGVWTLPPTYTLGDKDRAKYAAIGESDRMTLKFRKPQ
jgi:predicted methyltransferase